MHRLTRFLALLVGLLLVSGCTASRTPFGDRKASRSTVPTDGTTSPCPTVQFVATRAIRHLNLTPEPGPSPELGSQADLIWTFPDPESGTGRIMGVELNRGRIHPLMGSPFEGRIVRVRGFRATLSSIEDGFAILWKESDERCDLYALAAYGLSDEETLLFANGLRKGDP